MRTLSLLLQARICRAFLSGATDGSPHDLQLPCCDELELAVSISTQLRFIDQSATIMIEFGRKVLDMRRSLQHDRWLFADDGDGAEDRLPLSSDEHLNSCENDGRGSDRNNAVLADDFLIVPKKYQSSLVSTSRRSVMRQELIQRQVNVAEYFRSELDALDRSASVSQLHSQSYHPLRASSALVADAATALGSGENSLALAHQKTRQPTVELSVAACLRFQKSHLSQLQSLLGVHIRSSAERALFPSVDSTNGATGGDCSVDSTHEWIEHQWESVCRVQSEVRLVQNVIHYRKVILSLQSAMELFPDPVRIFMGAADASAAMYWTQYHGDRYYDDALLSGTVNLSSAKEQRRRKRRSQIAFTSPFEDSAAAGEACKSQDTLSPPSSAMSRMVERHSGNLNLTGDQSDLFCVQALRMAIRFAKSYLSSVDYDTSEDLLLLLHSSTLILDFRTALTHRVSRQRLQELTAKAQKLEDEKSLSIDCGALEIGAYASASKESDLIYQGLIESVSQQQVRGPLDDLVLFSSDQRQAEEWIDRGRAFLARGGAHLSIDLVPLLEQAKVLSKLRSMIRCSDWEALSRVLRLHRDQAAHWEYAGAEFDHIYQAYRFRCFQQELYKAVANFRSSEDLEHGLAGLQIDYHCLNQAFSEFLSILDYKSSLLHLHPVSNGEQLMEGRGANRCYILSDRFFVESNFIASKALWRLMNAVLHKRWFVKQRIHNNPQQFVAANIDDFLFSFFGLANADYIENVYSISHIREAVDALAAVHQSYERQNDSNGMSDLNVEPARRSKESFLRDAEETVFSVLIATNWSGFPVHVKKFFDLARNRLIDIYIRSDLIYYCSKGAMKLDAAGNIVLSDLFRKFLELSVEESDRAVAIARQLTVPFSWCKETQKWLKAARLIVQCRRELVEFSRISSRGSVSNSGSHSSVCNFPENSDDRWRQFSSLVQLLRGEGLLHDIPSDIYSETRIIREEIIGAARNAPSSQHQNLSWRLSPHLSAVEEELSVLERYCHGFHAERVLLQALHFLPTALQGHDTQRQSIGCLFRRIWDSPSLSRCREVIFNPAPLLSPSPHYREMLRCTSLLCASLLAAQEGKHVSFQQLALFCRLIIPFISVRPLSLQIDGYNTIMRVFLQLFRCVSIAASAN